jgi:hypothetical protein
VKDVVLIFGHAMCVHFIVEFGSPMLEIYNLLTASDRSVHAICELVVSESIDLNYTQPHTRRFSFRFQKHPPKGVRLHRQTKCQ